MDFRQLQYYVKVVDEESFSRAAEHLFVSQPSLSKAISRLEKEFNIKLIHRSAHAFKLTETGRLLYEKGKHVVSEYEQLNDYMRGISLSTDGIIKCGVPPVLNTILVPYILKDFKEYYPGIQIELHELPTKDMCQELLKHNLDLALGIMPADTELFDIEPIASDRVSLVMPCNHPLAFKEEIDAEDLRGEALVLLNSKYQLYDNILAACAQLGFTPDMRSTSLNWDFLISAVRLGVGLTILPRPILAQLDKDKLLVQRPFQGNIGRWEVVALMNKGTAPSALSAILIRFLQTELQYGF